MTLQPQMGKYLFCLGDCETAPHDWVMHSIAGLTLLTSPHLPVGYVVHRNKQVGLILGFPIDLYSGTVPVNFILASDPLDVSPFFAFEADLQRWAGRFIAIISFNYEARLYPDAASSYSVLFSKKLGRAASTRDFFSDQPLNEELIPSLRESHRASGTAYPAGLTEREGVQVLLPNHYLDLMTWRTTRYWPCATITRTNESNHVDDLILRIVGAVNTQFRAASQKAAIRVNITAGRDSRMMLGCAWEMRSELIASVDPEHSTIDAEIASEIAAHAGVQLTFGYPSDDRIWMLGLGGEVGRAFYWQQSDLRNTNIPTVEDLIQRLKFSPSDPICNALSDWLDQLPSGIDRIQALDLSYIEHRLACAMGHTLHRKDDSCHWCFFPFNGHLIYRCMLELPGQFRIKNGLYNSVINKTHYPLLSIPVNSLHYTGIEKWKWLALRLVKPSAIISSTSFEKFFYRGRESLFSVLVDDLLGLTKLARYRAADKNI